MRRVVRLRIGALLAAGALAASLGASARAQGDQPWCPVFEPAPCPSLEPPYAAAVPGSYLTTYANPLVVARVGGPLTFINTDIESHDVVARCPSSNPDNCADYYGSDDELWCVPTLSPPGKCPIFWSELIGIATTPVLGLDQVQPGKVYNFYCTKHPGMVGRLVVLP